MSNLRTISKEELDIILKKHKLWLNDEPGGERANLSKAYLSGADFSGNDLSWANLSEANLRWANLSGAKLSDADLSDANLSKTDLRFANLSGANLSEAYLRLANLRGADLSWSNLSGSNLSESNLNRADLSEAYIRWADLSGANLSETKLDWPLVCPEKGSFVGYKKCRDNLIVELEIQEDALRSSATTKKCRCSKAKVLSITNLDGSEANVEYAVSKKDSSFLYKIGKVISVDDFDTNRWNECSTGIHFFMTREEAVRYGY